MSDKTTRRMIAVYDQMKSPTMFLSGFFSTPAVNFHNTEEVEIDIVRSEEDIATVITDMTTGSNVKTFDGFTNKSFLPPIYSEAAALNSFDLMKRNAGENPFQNPDFQASATLRAMRQFRSLEAMVRRGVELQASQVLQTGVLTLTDKSGNAAYSLDYKPKATHFPTVGTSWASAAGDKLGDVDALAQVIRNDGLSDPDVLIFGDNAWKNFIEDDGVKALLDNRRMQLGDVRPEGRGEGATFMGNIWIGSYRYEMWTYSGRYKHPATGVITRFLDVNNVIVMSSTGRLDLTFGSIPLVGSGARALPGLPRRINLTGGGFGMTTNSWITPSGENLFVSAGTRPLCIPTAIDTYGAIITTP